MFSFLVTTFRFFVSLSLLVFFQQMLNIPKDLLRPISNSAQCFAVVVILQFTSCHVWILTS